MRVCNILLFDEHPHLAIVLQLQCCGGFNYTDYRNSTFQRESAVDKVSSSGDQIVKTVKINVLAECSEVPRK